VRCACAGQVFLTDRMMRPGNSIRLRIKSLKTTGHPRWWLFFVLLHYHFAEFLGGNSCRRLAHIQHATLDVDRRHCLLSNSRCTSAGGESSFILRSGGPSGPFYPNYRRAHACHHFRTTLPHSDFVVAHRPLEWYSWDVQE
jgi:hypothetical protein